MRITYFDTIATTAGRVRPLSVTRDALLRLTPITAIVALAAALRFYNLAALGYVNHYYAAAVEAMLQSWHNFFFAAAEPGGSVSVDKPPVGLWIETISAHFLGVNTLGLLLPEIVAGLLSVIVVYHLVRRAFGIVPGLLAALALAITPVVVATDRNNTIDSILILTLLLAAWTFIIATERGKLRYLLLGAGLVGVGFNIKMLEAYLPLPAFYALYFLGSKEGLWRKLGNMAVASALLAAISLSWVTIVDLTPADQRPYVGSSGDNSEMSLAIGYNGVERLLGMGGRGGLLSQWLGNLGLGPLSGQPQGRSGAFPGRPGGTFQRPPQGANGGFARRFPDGNGGAPPTGPGGLFGFGGPGGGIFGTGRASALRLFSAPLSKEASWLLPFGLFGAVLLASRARLRWPISRKHQALVLWGGWLLTAGIFFSVAGFFHEYYLSTLGAPLAALVGIGTAELWAIRKQHRWVASVLLLAAAAATGWLQYTTARAFVGSIWWLPVAIGVFAVGALLLIAEPFLRRSRLEATGFACVVAALLITPGIWSGLTTLNPSDNQSLPAAYSGRPSEPPNSGGLQVNQALLGYLESHTQGVKFLMAVPSSMQGADYVLATGRPVLYLGGFMGQDQVVTGEDLNRLVANGELRYIYWNGSGRGGFGGPGFGGAQSDISSWVAANCTSVQGFDTQTRNSGAPDGTSAGTANGGRQFGGPGGEMQVALYQCTSGGQ